MYTIERNALLNYFTNDPYGRGGLTLKWWLKWLFLNKLLSKHSWMDALGGVFFCSFYRGWGCCSSEIHVLLEKLTSWQNPQNTLEKVAREGLTLWFKLLFDKGIQLLPKKIYESTTVTWHCSCKTWSHMSVKDLNFYSYYTHSFSISWRISEKKSKSAGWQIQNRYFIMSKLVFHPKYMNLTLKYCCW